MTDKHKAILKIIERFLIDNPNQRFGQALFNLKINEFAGSINPQAKGHMLRDIYEDKDEAILKRMKDMTPYYSKQNPPHET